MLARRVSRNAGVLLAVASLSCANDYELFVVGGGSSGSGAPSTSTGALGGAPSGSAGDGGRDAGTGGGTAGRGDGGTGGANEAGAGGTSGTAGSSSGTGGAPGGSGGSGTGGAPPVASCADQYVGHMVCTETASSCEIYVVLGGVESCAQHCALFGGECLEVWDDVGNTCDHLAPLTCGGMNGDALCVCSHGCGAGPACQVGQTCANGTCM